MNNNNKTMFTALMIVLAIGSILITIVAYNDVYKEYTSALDRISELEDMNRSLDITISKLENDIDKLEANITRINKQIDTISEDRDIATKFSRGGRRSIKLHATGYTADHNKAPYYGLTASGLRAKEWHTVAVDPKQFKIGTVFYIPSLEKYNGTGIFVAEDTGGAVDYGDIDICVPTESDCFEKIGSNDIEVFVIQNGVGTTKR